MNIKQAIAEAYGCESYDELFENEDFAADMNDSVQPSWCKKCGAEGEPLEPDAENDVCESCGARAVSSLTMIVLF